jgi:hypothetical protein
MAYRPEFLEALTLLATAIGRLSARGYEAPVLVGGAAVELFTGGQITSGDFDFVSPWKSEFFSELEALGFERPESGWLAKSLLHPKLGFGVEVVSGALMDSLADKKRIRVIEIGEANELSVIPIEDLIADRMAQALAGRNIRGDMKNQAIRLYQLAGPMDQDYLNQRIATETGNAASFVTLLHWLKDEPGGEDQGSGARD